MKDTKKLLVGTAVAGIVAALSLGASLARADHHEGEGDKAAAEKNACKGKEGCKGHEAKDKASCSGKCEGKNGCKGKAKAKGKGKGKKAAAPAATETPAPAAKE